MEDTEEEIIEKIRLKGGQIFYNPKPLLNYEILVNRSLGSNTYRGFHRKNKKDDGSKVVFVGFFKSIKKELIRQLKAIRTYQELDEYENELCKTLKKRLEDNIILKQLKPYNKIRKPVDIMIEHLVAMGEDFDDVRKKLTPLLFLPLDSWMFKSDIVFSEDERKDYKIRKDYYYSDITKKEQYSRIQVFLQEKAKNLKFDGRIFFDLLWNYRYDSPGTNLLDTNPDKSEPC